MTRQSKHVHRIHDASIRWRNFHCYKSDEYYCYQSGEDVSISISRVKKRRAIDVVISPVKIFPSSWARWLLLVSADEDVSTVTSPTKAFHLPSGPRNEDCHRHQFDDGAFFISINPMMKRSCCCHFQVNGRTVPSIVNLIKNFSSPSIQCNGASVFIVSLMQGAFTAVNPMTKRQ